MNLKNKKILVGITAGIAAYKACELIRLLVKTGAQVKAVLTPNALNFVTETTLRTLTKNPVYVEQFNVPEWKPEHINLAEEADLFVIAPASANTISKIANGICDNLLTTMVMAFNKPLIIAPAMNCNMWENKFIQENIKKMENSGCHLVYPGHGELACGYEGAGRLAEVSQIFDKIVETLTETQILKGQKVLITAGGTKEPIDPVRYIGNRSSGKMGIALADAAWTYGADVCLICTYKVDKPYRVVIAPTAQEMHDAVLKDLPDYDMLLMAAAVADYRVKEFSEQKIKKNNNEIFNFELVKNPDILKAVAQIRTSSQKIIGFCAETENILENAKAKLQKKNLDYIIANDVKRNDTGFESDYNIITIIDKEIKNIQTTEKLLKTDISKIIYKYLLKN